MPLRRLSAKTRYRVDVGWRIGFTILVFLALWQGRGQSVDLEHATLANCREIEQIKTGARAAAWRDFNELNRSLKILKLEKTPEIVQAAKDSRDRRLDQYRREPCPRKIVTAPVGGHE